MTWYVAVAELPRWPSREEMGRILTEAGFRVDVGPYAFRLLDFEGRVLLRDLQRQELVRRSSGKFLSVSREPLPQAAGVLSLRHPKM